MNLKIDDSNQVIIGDTFYERVWVRFAITGRFDKLKRLYGNSKQSIKPQCKVLGEIFCKCMRYVPHSNKKYNEVKGTGYGRKG